MRILVLAPHPFYQHRGTPIAVKLLVGVLADRGHSIDILTYHEGEDVSFSKIKTYRITAPSWINNIKPGPSWKKIVCDGLMFFKCCQMIRNNNYDLIHAVEESAFMAIFMKTLFHIPYVYDMDSSLPRQISDKYKCLRIVTGIMGVFERMAMRSSLGILAVCKSLEEIAVNYAPGKLVVRLEDISLLQSESEQGEILKESLGIDGPVIMYIGNLEKYQGVDLLLDSFELARSKGADAHLVIIGGSEGDIKKYRDQSRKAGIGDRTHFIGQRAISQLGSFLEQADILVSPRTQGQNTPMKIYSYLESGRPVLATRLPTHTQVLDDKISLLVAPEKEAMSEGLVQLINDQQLGNHIALRAKERVKQEYTYDAFKRKLLGFYQVLEKELPSP